MRRSISVLRVVVLTALIAAAAACTSDDDGPDGEAYVDAVQADLSGGDDGDLAFDAETSACLADAIVTATDPARLEEADVTPEDLAAADPLAELDVLEPDEVRTTLEDEIVRCPTARRILRDVTASFPFEVAPTALDCMVEALDGSSAMAAAVAGVLVDDDEEALTEALVTGLSECPSVVGDLVAESITEAGFPVDEDARACLTDQIRDRGREAIDQLLGPDAEQLGVELTQACLPG